MCERWQATAGIRSLTRQHCVAGSEPKESDWSLGSQVQATARVGLRHVLPETRILWARVLTETEPNAGQQLQCLSPQGSLV